MNRSMRRFVAPMILSILVAGWGRDAAAQAIDGLVNLRFLPDVRVFAAMAAINAAGFDLDAENAAVNASRRLVRERLTRLPPGLRTRLQQFYRERDSERDPFAQQSKYISYALFLGGPPEFPLPIRPQDLPPEVAPVAGFETLLQELWTKGGLDRLWAEIRPSYVAEAESYRPLLRDMIVESLRYLRIDARVSLDRRVIFIPDLLNAFGIVNARNVGDDYFVVVGPTRRDGKLTASVRHEYLHYLLDPLVAKYRAYLPDAAPFLKRTSQMPEALPSYKDDFPLMVSESLVRAVDIRLRLAAPAARSEGILQDYERGWILVPYFDETLQKFEQGTPSVLELFPGILEGILWDAEARRDEAMAQLKRELTSRSASASPAQDLPQEPRSRARELLDQANSLLLARRFDEAEPLLKQALLEEEGNPNALFGLAQIAVRRMELEAALDLYERAAANSRDQAWIAGWSLVHRGNIYGQLGNIARARAEWNRVLLLKGNLRGAAEAASKALSESAPPPNAGPEDGISP
jgi:tetratricopeptide (TPR) repeat protein